TTVNTSADLSITQTGPATVTAGTDVTYHITATNNGPSDAASYNVFGSLSGSTVVSFVQDTGPTNGVSPLPAGATATFTLIVHVDPSAAAGSTISDTANITGGATSDPDTTNNTNTLTSTVATSADVSIVKTGPATVTAGTDVTYHITAVNNGPSDA